MQYIWETLNTWLIAIIDTIFAIWPATPNAFKLSALMTTAKGLVPDAPWWIVGTGFAAFSSMLTAVLFVKAFKLVWP